ncbi:MAG: FAD:protein FMN transferase [Deltaproteobacteria bacterium]|nr:FAD:protein FMN transferase [Deltaproteobacteria bacterium]
MLRSYLNKRLLGRLALLALILLPARSPAAEGTVSSGVPEVVRARWLMGTVLELRLPAGTRDAGLLAEAAFAEVSKVEAAASLWRSGTELAEVHSRASTGDAVVVSETLGDLVQEALRAAEISNGAYSPAVGALVAAYDLRGAGRWPSDEERIRSAALARPEGVCFDAATRTLRLDAGVTLDRDGMAKGFALDRAAEALRARGVEDALLNFGGQLLVIGPPIGAPGREALVSSPSNPGAAVLSVRMRDASLSTSADTERTRLVAGREAGHLLDPRTGHLVGLSGSVTTFAPSGAMADALSTAWAVEGTAAFRRSDPSSPLRRAGAVAFALAGRDGECETLMDPPFERLRPPADVVEAALHGP